MPAYIADTPSILRLDSLITGWIALFKSAEIQNFGVLRVEV
jgi:hypothetical protein